MVLTWCEHHVDWRTHAHAQGVHHMQLRAASHGLRLLGKSKCHIQLGAKAPGVIKDYMAS